MWVLYIYSRDLLGKPVATTKRYLNRLCEVGIIETIGYIGAFEVMRAQPGRDKDLLERGRHFEFRMKLQHDGGL